MLRIILAALFSTIAIIGCSDDKGVKARLSQNTYMTPEQVIQQGTVAMGKLNASQTALNSVSSQAIRSDTLGVRVTMTPAKDGFNFKVEHFEGINGDRCRKTTQNLQVPTTKLTSMNKGNGITLTCVDNTCTYMMVVIDRSHSSLLDSKGFVPAFVPLFLGVRGSGNGQRDFVPSQSRDPFLSLKANTVCTKPDALVTYEQPVVISPIDDNGPNYNYFPDDDNNTWIYN